MVPHDSLIVSNVLNDYHKWSKMTTKCLKWLTKEKNGYKIVSNNSEMVSNDSQVVPNDY